jgi:hypothetical protein
MREVLYNIDQVKQWMVIYTSLNWQTQERRWYEITEERMQRLTNRIEYLWNKVNADVRWMKPDQREILLRKMNKRRLMNSAAVHWSELWTRNLIPSDNDVWKWT